MLKSSLWGQEPIGSSPSHLANEKPLILRQALHGIVGMLEASALDRRPPLPGAQRLVGPGRAEVLRKVPTGLLSLQGAQCSQDSLKGLPGMGASWGGWPWFFHSIRHKSHPRSQPDPNRFDRDRLFSVVARGVPEDLAGLPEYLSRTSKYLTDSEYTGRPALWARATASCPLC